MCSPEQTKEPGCISSNFLFKNSYSDDHCQFVPDKDFSKADSEMFNYTHANITRGHYTTSILYYVLITVKVFQRKILLRTDPKLFDHTYALRILHVVTILPPYRFSRDYTTVAIIQRLVLG